MHAHPHRNGNDSKVVDVALIALDKDQVLHVPLGGTGGVTTLTTIVVAVQLTPAPLLVGTRSESVPSAESAVAVVEAGAATHAATRVAARVATRAARGSRTPGGYFCRTLFSTPQPGLRQERDTGSGAAVVSNGDAADTNVVAPGTRRCVASLWGAGWGKLGLLLFLLFAVPLVWSCFAASVGAGNGEAAFAEHHQRQIAPNATQGGGEAHEGANSIYSSNELLRSSGVVDVTQKGTCRAWYS